jgi:hypothetical protein
VSRIERVGRLPAAGVLAAFFVVAGAAGLGLDEAAQAAVAVTLVVLLIGYCWARPAGGAGVFLVAAAPSAIGEILEGVAGAPGWTAAVFVPLALLAARQEDADTAAPREPRPDPAAAAGG